MKQNSTSENLLQRALALSTEAHEGQLLDASIPMSYVMHVIETVMIMRSPGGCSDLELLAAGLLHDALEHTDLPAQTIRSELGPRVLELVQMVTRREPTEKEIEGLSKTEIYELRNRWLMEDIAKGMDDDARIIKLADRISNLKRAEETRSPKKLIRYMAQTDEMLSIISEKVSPPLHHLLRDDLAAMRKRH